MRNTILKDVVQMLRRELRLAESTSLGTNTRETHIYHLRSTQERLYADYKWPFMKCYRDVAMAAGQRYYGFPSDLNLEDAISAEARHANQYQPVTFGIQPCDYNISDSETDQRNDPPLKWDLYRDPVDDGDMFEIWPIPASLNATMRFYGTKALGALVDEDTDTADLDDLLLVYFAAAELAPKDERQQRFAKANAHYTSLKSKLNKTKMFVMGGGMPVVPQRREIIVALATP